MATAEIYDEFDSGDHDESLFARIANDLIEKGYSICPAALPIDLCAAISEQLESLDANEFKPAGIGRGDELNNNEFVRSDKICWFTGETETGARWLDWSAALQRSPSANAPPDPPSPMTILKIGVLSSDITYKFLAMASD